jgi:hypothetical protein
MPVLPDSINSIREQLQRAHEREVVQGMKPDFAWFRSAVAAKHAKGTIVQAIQAELSRRKGGPGALTLEGCFMAVARRKLRAQVVREMMDEARGLLQEETA